MRSVTASEVALMRPSLRPPLQGTRIVLRLPAAADCNEWIRLRQANWRYLRSAEPTPLEGFDPCGPEAFDKLLAGVATERSVRMLVCSASEGGILGQISFSDISRGCFQSCFVGYWMRRDYAGSGLMSEALSMAVHYAFSGLELHRVEANIAPGNLASRAVAARCGFRCEGRARRLLHLDGRWRDHERWAIIRDS
jgi:[ribosomal protein S5]-alanine N-acetyltransferase